MTTLKMATAVAFPLVILCSSVCVRSQAGSPSDAIALEREGKYAEAARVWREIIKSRPKDAGAFASLGIDLSKEKKYPEAVSAYETASH